MLTLVETLLVRHVGTGWPFAVLGVINTLVVFYAWKATRMESASQHDIFAFDVTVEYGIQGLAFMLLATIGLIDPTVLGSATLPGSIVMASGTVLGFAAIGIGRFYFVWSRLRAQRGTHPFQRALTAPSIAETVAKTEA